MIRLFYTARKNANLAKVQKALMLNAEIMEAVHIATTTEITITRNDYNQF